AEAEAKATAMVSQAIAAGDVNAINYFVAQKYVEAFAELARNPTAKTVIVPAEMSGLVGTIAGLGELVGLAKEQQQGRSDVRRDAPPPPPSPPPPPRPPPPPCSRASPPGAPTYPASPPA
ncbi:band-7 C-terminal domain-containing protein, partial [Brevundimonas sp. UBA2416]|uniref:band-7 C-terminal domain-containing protein n=1 Tax=Brevundimonas sp. UBA2416 TaxID=1946124 RepID=UPI0025C50633